jgi:hypothetical protein
MVAAGLALGGCVVNLPPPPIPERTMTAAVLPGPPPPPGTSAVTIDTVGEEPSVVEEVTGHVAGQVVQSGRAISAFTYSSICRSTPCIANLTPGVHDLQFTSRLDPLREGAFTIDVGPAPSNVRYALGHGGTFNGELIGGLVAVSMGAPMAISGGVLFGVGSSESGSTTLKNVGAGLLAGAVVLVVVGAVLLVNGRPEVQDGAGVQWTP